MNFIRKAIVLGLSIATLLGLFLIGTNVWQVFRSQKWDSAEHGLLKNEQSQSELAKKSSPKGMETEAEGSSQILPDNTPTPTLSEPFNTTIIIEGDAEFVKNTENALSLIKEKSPEHNAIVEKYIGKIQLHTFSGMAAYDDPPTFLVGSSISNASVTYYASSIVHDANHSKLYNDYQSQYGYVPDEIWTGYDPEQECLAVQIIFLEKINAPQSEIDYAKSLIGENWWDGPRDW